LLAPFRYILHYRPGKQNLIADLLSRKAQDLITQKTMKKWSQNQVLLPFDRFTGGALQANILAVLPNTPEKPEELDIPLEQGSRKLLLIDVILSANRESPILLDQRKLAAANINRYAIYDDLLVHQNQLMVPDENILRTRLCNEFHRSAHRAHSGRGKMRKIIFQQYFWPGMGSYIDRYVGNCPECKRNRNSRLKPAGLLHLLPIP
jgi:hypothetical protein